MSWDAGNAQSHNNRSLETVPVSFQASIVWVLEVVIRISICKPFGFL